MELDGQRALVTGGAGALGRVVCRELARAGADVVVVDLDAAGAEEVARSVREEGRAARAVAVDLTDFDAVQRALHDRADRLAQDPDAERAAG